MPTKTLYADRSSALAQIVGGAALGGGLDAHLPIQKTSAGGSYTMRGVVGFTFPAGFWSDIRRVTKAELRLTTTPSSAHLTKGGSPFLYLYRATSQWTANANGESWSTSPTVYPGPSATGSGGVSGAIPTTAGLTFNFDITTMFMAWAPNTVLGPTGVAGLGAAMYGISLQESGGAAQAHELCSAKWTGTASQKPNLFVTYESNSPPNAPTLVYPVGPDQPAAKFKFQTTDPESDAISNYDLQVSTDPAFATVTHWNVANGTGGLVGNVVDVTYAGTALTNGERYYWRARMRDVGSGTQSPWSGTATFVKSVPGAPEDFYDYWMAAILADMADGRTVLRVGTLRPRGEQVALLTSGEYGDRYELVWDEVSPTVEEPLYLLGQNVALTPDGWSITAVFELAKEVG